MISLASWRRRAVAFVAAALALCSGQTLAQSASAFKPSADDAVLLQMQVRKYRMANDLRGYQTPDGVCVDLADVIQSLDLPIRLDKKSRRATGWIFSEAQTFTLDRDQNAVQIVNNKRPLQPGEIYDTPEGWCVSSKSLAGWLGVTLTVNVRNSTVTLDSDKPLPFIEALERRSRAARLSPDRERDLSRYPQASQPYAMWRLPSVDVVAQASVRSNGGHTQLDRRYELYASGEVALASYDARLASDADGKPASLRVRAFRNDPDGKMLGPLKATQVAAGDVELLPGNLAGASSVGRGAFISNRPLQRATRFGTTILRGELPLGWDAELYRNGQLLAFQSEPKDGRYEFDVQLIYGQNDLEVVLYGPQGQVRRESQSIPVGYGAVPPGKVEYWAGVVDRNRDLITFSRPPPTGPPDEGWHFAAGAQYGIDRRTVVGASAHSLVLDGQRRDYSELEVQRAVGPMLLNLSAAEEFGGGQAYRFDLLGRLGKINIQAETTYVAGQFVSGEVDDTERSAAHLSFDTVLQAGRTVLPISGEYRRTETRDGHTVNEALLRAGVILPHVALTTYVLDRHSSGFGALNDGTEIGLLINTRVAGITVRGEGAYRLTGPKPGLDTASVTLEKALDDRSDVRLDVTHESLTSVTEFELGYVRQLKRLALRVSGTADSNGGLGATLGVSFSLGRDPLRGSWRMSSDKLAQLGEAAVSVFLDEDGDGHRSPGEKALEGVGINAGSSGVAEPTDKQGRAFVEDLQPYQKVLVSVDESTLPDPFLVTRGKGVVVTPRPGVPTVVELAVTPTGEAEGVLEAPEGTTLAGVELELIAANGSVVAQTRTEFDGYFLFEKVPYGHYRLRLSVDSEKAFGVQGELGGAIALDAKKQTVKVGTVKLRAPTTLAAAGSSP